MRLPIESPPYPHQTDAIATLIVVDYSTAQKKQIGTSCLTLLIEQEEVHPACKLKT